MISLFKVKRSFGVKAGLAVKGDRHSRPACATVAGKLAGAITPASSDRRPSGVTRHGIAGTQPVQESASTANNALSFFINKGE